MASPVASQALHRSDYMATAASVIKKISAAPVLTFRQGFSLSPKIIMVKTFYSLASVIFFCCLSLVSKAQKVDSIYFHLYTDSLKKGVYDYINVDGKLSNGRYMPLNNKSISFTSNTGTWDGNSLIIDSSYSKDSVVITAVLKEKTEIKKTITIYMKKNLDNERLKTEEEIMNDLQGKKKRRD